MKQTSFFLTPLLILLLGTCGRAQVLPPLHHQDITTFNPDELLVQGDKLPKILLVGTFHFDYPNLDSHVTDAADQIDVASAEKQAEVQELLDYIARFKPTKIVVERRPGSSVNDAYREYLAGNRELKKGEIEQLGFRLGKRFGIDTLILGDAFPFQNSLYWNRDSAVYRPLIDSLWEVVDTGWDTTVENRYWDLYDYEDKLTAKSSLLDVFRYQNDPHRIHRGHGHYLEFESDERVDVLAMWWYSRNLRIARRIRQSTTSPDDRILVLFGAGHLGILRQQFESSPAYELVDFAALDAVNKPSVAVLGTLHLHNPGNDKINVDMGDILSPVKQAELQEVIDAVASYRPTKVAFEWVTGDTLWSRHYYRAWLDGRLEDIIAPDDRYYLTSEMVQIAYPIARAAGLTELHPIDYHHSFPLDSALAWAEANGQEQALANFQAFAARAQTTLDSMAALPIISTLRYCNSRAFTRDLSQQLYLNKVVSFGKGSNYSGSHVVEQWYLRNVRIFTSLTRIVEKDDRVLVIYGAGHKDNLDDMAQDRTDWNWVDGASLLEKF